MSLQKLMDAAMAADARNDKTTANCCWVVVACTLRGNKAPACIQAVADAELSGVPCAELQEVG